MKFQSRGFTLIELLVVIAIIGLLSAVILASLNTARIKGRDAARFSDMQSVAQALQLYADDNNGLYPLNSTCTSGSWCLLSSIGSALVPKYLPSIPADPNPSFAGTFQDYHYCSGGHGYLLALYEETSSRTCIPPTSAPSTACAWISSIFNKPC